MWKGWEWLWVVEASTPPKCRFGFWCMNYLYMIYINYARKMPDWTPPTPDSIVQSRLPRLGLGLPLALSKTFGADVRWRMRHPPVLRESQYTNAPSIPERYCRAHVRKLMVQIIVGWPMLGPPCLHVQSSFKSHEHSTYSSSIWRPFDNDSSVWVLLALRKSDEGKQDICLHVNKLMLCLLWNNLQWYCKRKPWERGFCA